MKPRSIKKQRKNSCVSFIKRFLENTLKKYSPRILMQLRYYRNTGLVLNLSNPKTMDEKINYMSFNFDTTLWSKLTDKIEVHNYVKKLGFEDILNPVIATFNTANEIDFTALPSAFVLKTNNASGTNYFVKNKELENIDTIREIFKKWLLIDYGYETATPHYSKIKPKIFAERFLIDPNLISGTNPLVDYKFYCVNGNPEYVVEMSDRKVGTHKFRRMIYDMNWLHKPEYINDGLDVADLRPMPTSFSKMKEIASALSTPFPFVRVDLYEINNKPIFGEMTFTPGHHKAWSLSFQKMIGEMIDLNYHNT